MNYVQQLTEVLQQDLSWNKARLKFMARYVGALLKLTTTNGKELALTLNPNVKDDSNYRRIQRFMADYAFDFASFGDFLRRLLKRKSDYTVIMDRTEWHFGTVSVNVLMIGFACGEVAVPICWDVLGQKGSSSTAERIALFERFLEQVETEDIRAFVADREFISAEWLGFLVDREVPFVIRIRSNRNIALNDPEGPALPARMFFRPLSSGQARQLKGNRYVGGQPAARVKVIGKRLPPDKRDDFLILLVNGSAASRAFEWYRQRWEIETLFGALKSRGFDLETTHATKPERIAKLIGLLSLALMWSLLVGRERHKRDPLTIKKHGYPEKSLFRYGLDHLRAIMLNLAHRQEAFERCLQALINPSKFLSCS